MAPQVGLEPTTLRLTAGCSAIELLRSAVFPRVGRCAGVEISPLYYHHLAAFVDSGSPAIYERRQSIPAPVRFGEARCGPFLRLGFVSPFFMFSTGPSSRRSHWRNSDFSGFDFASRTCYNSPFVRGGGVGNSISSRPFKRHPTRPSNTSFSPCSGSVFGNFSNIPRAFASKPGNCTEKAILTRKSS